MSNAEQFLSDEDILERLAAFESEEFPPDECAEYAEVLAKYCRGEVTERAIQTLVENFPEDRLPELVRKHAAPTLSTGVDYCQGQRGNALAYALINRGFGVESGWRVSWAGGEVQGKNLCRLALLAVWLRGIQQPGEGDRQAGP